jgi:hypothetical protein
MTHASEGVICEATLVRCSIGGVLASTLLSLGPCVHHSQTCPHAYLLSASKGHMPPNFAQNRKPCRFEGSPVIHHGVTVQLLVSILWGGAAVQGSFLPLPPCPWLPSGAEPAGTFLITSGGAQPDCLSQVFIYLPRLFWGQEAEECGVL